MQRFAEGVSLSAGAEQEELFGWRCLVLSGGGAVLVARNFSELRKVTEMAAWKFCVLPASRRDASFTLWACAAPDAEDCRANWGILASRQKQGCLEHGRLKIPPFVVFSTLPPKQDRPKPSRPGQARLETPSFEISSRLFESGTSSMGTVVRSLPRGRVVWATDVRCAVTPLSLFSGAWLSQSADVMFVSPRPQSLVARR